MASLLLLALVSCAATASCMVMQADFLCDPQRCLNENGSHKFGENVPSDQCEYFCMCSGDRVERMRCPKGLHFNAKLQVCDFPSSANCDPLYSNNAQSTGGTSNNINVASSSRMNLRWKAEQEKIIEEENKAKQDIASPAEMYILERQKMEKERQRRLKQERERLECEQYEKELLERQRLQSAAAVEREDVENEELESENKEIESKLEKRLEMQQQDLEKKQKYQKKYEQNKKLRVGIERAQIEELEKEMQRMEQANKKERLEVVEETVVDVDENDEFGSNDTDEISELLSSNSSEQ